MITAEVTREIAEAQVSDYCEVELWVEGLPAHRPLVLTVAQAVELANELMSAVIEAKMAEREAVQS